LNDLQQVEQLHAPVLVADPASWRIFLRIAGVASRWAGWIDSLVCFAARGEHPQRAALLMAFFRLRVKMSLYSIARRPLRSFTLLGTEMRFANPHTFSFLLMELFIQESYKGCDPAPATVLDLGSNIGMSILLFKSLWPECSVVGVEASPDSFAILEQNVRGLSSVAVMNRAVSDQSGEVTFYSVPGSLVGSTNKLRGRGDATLVKAVPLSEFITGPLDLLKIDIEGSEITAFAELEASEKMPLISQMIVEYHHHNPGEWHSLAGFLARLERCGFSYELGSALPPKYGQMQDVVIRARRI
jgi:FkbM family methyltransferase